MADMHLTARRRTRAGPRTALLATSAALIPLAAFVATGDARAQAIIDNGTVQIGINPYGNLVTGGIGIVYLPTGNEALAPGCACEAWGLADFLNPATGFGIGASTGDTSTAGVTSSAVLNVSGTGTHGSSAGSSAVSTTQIAVGGNPFAEVVHAFNPSASVNLYEVEVTITNTGSGPIADLRYRRAMDWDVEPTPFAENVTLQGWPASGLVASSDNGFADGNPFTAQGSIAPGTVNQNFEQSGPGDHGAVFDFSFSSLAVGASRTFSIFYGAAATLDEALAALTAVNAEVYSLGIPNDAGGFNATGGPNTFIFGFAGVGGTPVGGAVPVNVSTSQALQQIALLAIRHHMESIGMRMNGLVGGGDAPIEVGTVSTSEAGLAPLIPESTLAEGLRLFADGTLTFGDFATLPAGSADFETQGINAGVDLTWLTPATAVEAVNVGFALGYGHGRAEEDAASISPVTVESESYSLSAFAGASFLGGGYANTILGYTFSDYEQQRLQGADRFEGDTGGEQLGALLRLGYDVGIVEAPSHLVTIGPFALAEYLSGDVDGFSEESVTAPGTALTYADTDYESLRTQLGARTHLQRSMPWGSAALTVKAAWEHQFGDGSRTTIATTSGGLGSLAAAGLEDDDLVNFGARVAANFRDRVTVAGEYEGTVGDSFEEHAFKGRLRVGF